MEVIKIFKNFIVILNRAQKFFILRCIDFISLYLSFVITNWLLINHLGGNYITKFDNFFVFLIIFLSIFIYSITGQYNGLTRYRNSRSFYNIACRNLLLILIINSLSFALYKEFIPFKYSITFWIIITGALCFIRVILRDILLKMNEMNISKKKRVAIYGAGAAGAQLAASLRLARSHNIMFFIDDNLELYKRNLGGIPILPPSSLKNKKNNLDQVLLAIPSLNKANKASILESLQNQGIPVLMVPSIDDLSSGRAKINALQPIAIEDLLTRDIVSPNNKLLKNSIKGKVVCVTGAGGSIGSELCRQILNNSPSIIILIERNEPSLYKINQELIEVNNSEVPIKSILGSVIDFNLLVHTFKKYKVDIVFHAAAYKHVPLVELNPISGLRNNVFSTVAISKAAIEAEVEKMILISSDKAVRPTNIMGASKRLSELIFQAHSEESVGNNNKTCFSMVRFGNVLNSSGSVVPIFKRQIALGGPITLTDKRIIRYIMTIPEASQLVIQSATLAKGGEVFILDMGEPILIEDLAKKMIRLSGLSVKDKNNPKGDIEIIITGLRPGEKLFEELLICSDSQSTEHPLIYKAKEEFISPKLLWKYLDELWDYIEKRDLKKIKKLLKCMVPDWVDNAKSY